MRGLPFTATHEDIKQFFEGFQLAEGGDNPVLDYFFTICYELYVSKRVLNAFTMPF